MVREARKVLLLATPISTPERISRVWSARRAAWLPAALQTAISRAALRRAAAMAAMVSAVSPDWPTATTSVLSSRNGSR